MDQENVQRFEIIKELETLFEKELNLVVEDSEVDLIETGTLDSLLFVEIIMLLESNFGIVVNINEIEFDDFRCIRNIGMFIERSLAD